ncbi:MAG: FHA domain-containing protein, partial [Deltaproteobacteria bacterium]
EDHLVVRDEGSANGVFVKVRDSVPLEPGDFFVAGERLFRYDGPTDLPRNGEGDTPFLGAPRPQGNAVRVSEILAGGKTGRTCNRAGPVIAIGRTGCDMNFPSDALMAAKHTEVRISEDGTATLVDLGAGPSGVFVRVRAQSQHDLQGGDIVMVGDQILRVEVG